jgi:hypothetical protein
MEKGSKTMSKEKKVYTTPKLTVHGTVEQLTRAKDPGGGDGLEQWPYGKIVGIADSMDMHSRS